MALESKGENTNCLQKIVQSIFYHSCQDIALSKGNQDEESSFKQLLLLRAEDNEVLQKSIEKSYDKHMSLNSENEMRQIMAPKMLHAIAKGHS